MRKYITTKEGLIRWLIIVSNQWNFLAYNFEGSIYDYIKWSINDWNKGQPPINKIKIDELGINEFYLKELKQCFFNNKEEIIKDREDQNTLQDLKNRIFGE